MRQALFIIFVALCTAATYDFNKLLKPVEADYVMTQQNIAEVGSGLGTLRDLYKNLRNNAYSDDYLSNPTPRATPHSAKTIEQLAHNMKKLRKSLLKPQDVPEGSTPEEMMLFQRLLGGLKRTSRKRDAEPAMHEASQVEIDSLQRLADQVNLVANDLESPEENALHAHAHAQSRMLHRMNHVMDAMSGEMESEKQRHYEDMMSTLLHQHLADPDYHDSLHDHLLAHHLARSHQDDEFVDHLTHHMLYNNLDNKVQDEDYSSAIGTVLNSNNAQRNDLYAQQNQMQMQNYAQNFMTQDTNAKQAFANELSQRTNNAYQVAKPVTTQQQLSQYNPTVKTESK
jgi:hypothetical protein